MFFKINFKELLELSLKQDSLFNTCYKSLYYYHIIRNFVENKLYSFLNFLHESPYILLALILTPFLFVIAPGSIVETFEVLKTLLASIIPAIPALVVALFVSIFYWHSFKDIFLKIQSFFSTSLKYIERMIITIVSLGFGLSVAILAFVIVLVLATALIILRSVTPAFLFNRPGLSLNEFLLQGKFVFSLIEKGIRSLPPVTTLLKNFFTMMFTLTPKEYVLLRSFPSLDELLELARTQGQSPVKLMMSLLVEMLNDENNSAVTKVITEFEAIYNGEKTRPNLSLDDYLNAFEQFLALDQTKKENALKILAFIISKNHCNQKLELATLLVNLFKDGNVKTTPAIELFSQLVVDRLANQGSDEETIARPAITEEQKAKIKTHLQRVFSFFLANEEDLSPIIAEEAGFHIAQMFNLTKDESIILAESLCFYLQQISVASAFHAIKTTDKPQESIREFLENFIANNFKKLQTNTDSLKKIVGILFPQEQAVLDELIESIFADQSQLQNKLTELVASYFSLQAFNNSPLPLNESESEELQRRQSKVLLAALDCFAEASPAFFEKVATNPAFLEIVSRKLWDFFGNRITHALNDSTLLSTVTSTLGTLVSGGETEKEQIKKLFTEIFVYLFIDQQRRDTFFELIKNPGVECASLLDDQLIRILNCPIGFKIIYKAACYLLKIDKNDSNTKALLGNLLENLINLDSRDNDIPKLYEFIPLVAKSQKIPIFKLLRDSKDFQQLILNNKKAAQTLIPKILRLFYKSLNFSTPEQEKEFDASAEKIIALALNKDGLLSELLVGLSLEPITQLFASISDIIKLVAQNDPDILKQEVTNKLITRLLMLPFSFIQQSGHQPGIFHTLEEELIGIDTQDCEALITKLTSDNYRGIFCQILDAVGKGKLPLDLLDSDFLQLFKDHNDTLSKIIVGSVILASEIKVPKETAQELYNLISILFKEISIADLLSLIEIRNTLISPNKTAEEKNKAYTSLFAIVTRNKKVLLDLLSPLLSKESKLKEYMGQLITYWLDSGQSSEQAVSFLEGIQQVLTVVDHRALNYYLNQQDIVGAFLLTPGNLLAAFTGDNVTRLDLIGKIVAKLIIDELQRDTIFSLSSLTADDLLKIQTLIQSNNQTKSSLEQKILDLTPQNFATQSFTQKEVESLEKLLQNQPNLLAKLVLKEKEDIASQQILQDVITPLLRSWFAGEEPFNAAKFLIVLEDGSIKNIINLLPRTFLIQLLGHNQQLRAAVQPAIPLISKYLQLKTANNDLVHLEGIASYLFALFPYSPVDISQIDDADQLSNLELLMKAIEASETAQLATNTADSNKDTMKFLKEKIENAFKQKVQENKHLYFLYKTFEYFLTTKDYLEKKISDINAILQKLETNQQGITAQLTNQINVYITSQYADLESIQPSELKRILTAKQDELIKLKQKIEGLDLHNYCVATFSEAELKLLGSKDSISDMPIPSGIFAVFVDEIIYVIGQEPSYLKKVMQIGLRYLHDGTIDYEKLLDLIHTTLSSEILCEKLAILIRFFLPSSVNLTIHDLYDVMRELHDVINDPNARANLGAMLQSLANKNWNNAFDGSTELMPRISKILLRVIDRNYPFKEISQGDFNKIYSKLNSHNDTHEDYPNLMKKISAYSSNHKMCILSSRELNLLLNNIDDADLKKKIKNNAAEHYVKLRDGLSSIFNVQDLKLIPHNALLDLLSPENINDVIQYALSWISGPQNSASTSSVFKFIGTFGFTNTISTLGRGLWSKKGNVLNALIKFLAAKFRSPAAKALSYQTTEYYPGLKVTIQTELELLSSKITNYAPDPHQTYFPVSSIRISNQRPSAIELLPYLRLLKRNNLLAYDLLIDMFVKEKLSSPALDYLKTTLAMIYEPQRLVEIVSTITSQFTNRADLEQLTLEGCNDLLANLSQQNAQVINTHDSSYEVLMFSSSNSSSNHSADRLEREKSDGNENEYENKNNRKIETNHQIERSNK